MRVFVQWGGVIRDGSSPGNVVQGESFVGAFVVGTISSISFSE